MKLLLERMEAAKSNLTRLELKKTIDEYEDLGIVDPLNPKSIQTAIYKQQRVSFDLTSCIG